MLHDLSASYKQKSVNCAEPSSLFAFFFSLDMEAAAFQNCKCIELQEEVKKLTELQRECKAEIQQLEDKLDDFLDCFKNLSEKREVLLPKAPTSDESRQYAGSSSFNETSLEGRPLVDGASLKSQPSMFTVLIPAHR